MATASAQETAPLTFAPEAPARTRYRIDFTLDFDRRTFKGVERLRWVNQDDRPASVLFFHLYANLRRPETPQDSEAKRGSGGALRPGDNDGGTSKELPGGDAQPRLVVEAVRAAASGQALPHALDGDETLLRVTLREPVTAGGSVEIEIEFSGSVPEIDPDETSLPAHVIQQLGAALQDTREMRSARDLNFQSRGVLLLGTAYPVLAVRDGGDWQREVRPGVGDWSHTEVADYEVTVSAPAGVAVYASGAMRPVRPAAVPDGHHHRRSSQSQSYVFAGDNLRNFAVLAGRTLRSAETAAGGVLVRSIWTNEHERAGRRTLEQAAAAVRVFTKRFGPLPFESVSIAEAPLVAGLGSAEFAGLGIIAGALYVDFDSPAMRSLPEIVREQRSSVEDSLEFTVAHMIAHQWWGVTVGNAPDRQPVLDEALAHWSALLYYQDTHGIERAAQARDDQLRGVYEIYRTFGGEDMPADRPAREYRNSFQYAAIVSGKGALLFSELRNLLGEERYFTALRQYLEANRFEIARLDDLRGAFIAEAPLRQRRVVTRMFDRWLSERYGDEDVAPPNPQLAAALGISAEPSASRDRNAFSRLGRFFWRQMTRIR
ncbi:MAG: hypothetical protein M3Q76_14080 [Acidobacteriota bacterium]|nr:hypothetical protein [Acidobacteriota bacterium]